MNTPQNAEVLRAVLLTAFLCGSAAFFVLRHQERRHERDMQAMSAQHVGMPPPGHPDWDTRLEDYEEAEWVVIEARLVTEDAGLGVFEGEGDDW